MDGTYTNTWENSDGAALTYTLTLKSDGTFLFESLRVYESSDPTKIVTVRGIWSQKDRLLILNTDASAEDDELAKNLNSTKARFRDYSQRHVQYGKIKPSLEFYKSDVFHSKGMELEKAATETLTSSF
jgi:hypothetical protein